jgi:hypothetical protein
MVSSPLSSLGALVIEGNLTIALETVTGAAVPPMTSTLRSQRSFMYDEDDEP